MPYQYYCPCAQRQLLEGAEATAGQQVQCPYCPQIFVQPIPQQATVPAGGSPNVMPGGFPGQPGGSGMMPGMAPGMMTPGGSGVMHPGMPGMPPGGSGMMHPGGSGVMHPGGSGVMHPMPGMLPGGSGGFPGPGGSGAYGMPGGMVDPSLDPIVHVTCKCDPRRPIPAQKSMMGQDVLCPYCNEILTLHFEDTIEYKREREEYLRRKDEQMSKRMFNWAIGVAVLVGIGILTMIIILVLDTPAK